ncbi:MAG: hypothetical protein ACYTHM_15945 [Planctomycetota bacterium]|jgi:hypothetical protein
MKRKPRANPDCLKPYIPFTFAYSYGYFYTFVYAYSYPTHFRCNLYQRRNYR